MNILIVLILAFCVGIYSYYEDLKDDPILGELNEKLQNLNEKAREKMDKIDLIIKHFDKVTETLTEKIDSNNIERKDDIKQLHDSIVVLNDGVGKIHKDHEKRLQNLERSEQINTQTTNEIRMRVKRQGKEIGEIKKIVTEYQTIDEARSRTQEEIRTRRRKIAATIATWTTIVCVVVGMIIGVLTYINK